MSHNYGFYRPETEKIVEAHANDFNILTEAAYLKKCGGYEAYVKSLGGVFAELYAKTIKNPTGEQWQKCCDYVWGLASIWGVDYDNGGTHWKWGNGTSDRYYTDATAVKKRYYNGWNIDEMLTKGNGRPLNTNCNYFAQVILGKIGVWKATTKVGEAYLKSVGGKRVLKKSELKPGDLVHFYDKNNHWHHVSVVGRVVGDKVLCYDTGSRWIRNRKREFEFTVDANNKTTGAFGYGGKWIGVHYFDLVKSIPYENRTDAQLAAEVMLKMHGKGDGRKKDLGNRYDKVQAIVETLVKNHAALIDALADYVLDGLAGKDEVRKKLLGKYYDEVQKRVTYIWNTAEDVWAGKYGTGETRKKILGADYDIIMRQVNRTRERHK